MTILSDAAIADQARRAGFAGDSVAIAVAVALAESKGDTDALGDVGLETATWGPSVGLWQIRSLNAEKGKGTSRDELANHDPYHNAQAAYAISGGGGNWRPWSTYTNGAYARYMDRGTTAAGQSSPGSPAGPNFGPDVSRFRTGDQLQAITSFENSPTAAPDFPFAIRGRQVDGNLDDYVVGGTVELDASQVWQITFTLEDPGLRILGTGLLELGTPVDAGEIHWAVAAVSVDQGPAQEQITITLRTSGAEKLKQDRAARTEQNATPFAYVSHEARDAGLITTGGKTDHSLFASRPSIGRNPANTADPTSRAESGWEAVQRIAKEVGAWCWEGGYSTLYFGMPKRFLQDSVGFDVKWRAGPDEEHLAPLGVPQCRRTNDDPEKLAEVTCHLPPSRGKQVRPGMRLQLAGVPGFEESFIVSRVKWSLDRGATPVEVTAVTPRDPDPSDKAIAATDPRYVAATPGTRSALDFVAFALRQAGKQYIYGGPFTETNPDPQNFDCSELVDWAAFQVGVHFPRPSGTQYAACQKAGTTITVAQALTVRGAVLFMGAGGTQHVAISLGDGTTIEARGRAYGVLTVPNAASRGFTLAGLVPGLLYNGVDAGTAIAGLPIPSGIHLPGF